MTRTPVVATVVIAVAVLAYWGAGVAAASRKLAPLEPLAAKGAYAVTLAFPPERFHQVKLQDQGRVVEVRDRTVYMMEVAPKSIRELAGEYWVDSVAAWDGKR